MAIQILLEHGVLEENIIFLNLISAPEGISHLVSKHPRVTIVTGEVDERLNDHGYILPGIGVCCFRCRCRTVCGLECSLLVRTGFR